MTNPTYWLSPVPDLDDFGNPIHDEFIDGRTEHGGAWAMMTPAAWVRNTGTNLRLGLGLGQRYKLQSDGKWLKVEG